MKKGEDKKNKDKSGSFMLLEILVVITIFIGGCILILYCQNISFNENDDEIKSDNANEDKEIYESNYQFDTEVTTSGVKFYDIYCYWDGSNTHFTYKVTNTTNKNIKVSNYKMVLYDNFSEITRIMYPYLGLELVPGEVYEGSVSTIDDLSEVNKLEISL